MKSLIFCVAFALSSGTAALESSGAPVDHSPTPAPNFSVCIDPGHPSENNHGGALTQGLREVTVNWQVALLLRQELEKDGITIVMTKKREDEFVTNENRAAIANENHSDLFLRLHADAGNSTGFTVYYPRKQGSARSVTGPPADVLRSSATAAKSFHKCFAFALAGKLRDNGLHGDEQTLIGGRQGALTGSIFSKVRTILVEMVFLTNRADAEWIKQPSNQLVMAKALAAGVRAVRSGQDANCNVSGSAEPTQ
jgi:N-acetylmuramoyl-L-alanine amidase